MRKLAAGNWKMNGTGADLAEVASIAAALPDGVEVLLCPPATLLHRMAAVAGAIRLGGQDSHAAAAGAHTGDISASMLAEAGATYVLLGHSERRADHGESDAAVKAKAAAATAAGLAPVICVGETLAQREAGETLAVVGGQVAGSLPDGPAGALVIAYEPVWAIGTGKVPTTDEIAEVHRFLRDRLRERYGAEADGIRLLYGGSVKPGNAAAIFAVPDVDGALVGGASLKAADFAPIIAALAAS
jgi:triosephosphate isomerase